MPHFRNIRSIRTIIDSKMGHFRKNEQSKSGAFQEKNTWSDFEQKKREKLKLFDFGAFQEKLHMPSRAKYLLHKLFGAFHDTPCIEKWGISKKKHVINSKAENEPKKKSELISDLIPKKNEKSKFSKNF